MFYRPALLALAFTLAPLVSYGEVIVAFDMTGQPGNELYGYATAAAPHVYGNRILRGDGLTATAGTNSFAASGWEDNSQSDYFSFGIQVVTGYQVTLTDLLIATRSSSTGPGSLWLYYNYTGTLDIIRETFDQSGATIVNSDVDLQNLTVTGNASFTIFRNGFTGSASGGAVSPSGTFRIANYTDPDTSVISPITFLGTVSRIDPSGDFNGDGMVDAADYDVWRRGLGTVYTQTDYDVWRTHFGQTIDSGSGASANDAVPEPVTLLLLLMGVPAICCLGRSGQTSAFRWTKAILSLTKYWLTACVAAALAIQVQPAIAQISDVPGWQLSWHDEFEDSSLNTANWTALNRQDSFNNEKQYYTPGQVTVANGNLQLTATNAPLRNKAYGSGLITSNALYGPGRFEARIDLPTTQGMWPAFWLNPNQAQWPLGGEIDVMENRGSEPSIVSSAFHWQKDQSIPCCDAHQFVGHAYSATTDGNPVNFTTGFHTYAVEWDKLPGTSINEIRYYVDDVLHMTVDQDSSMSDANFTTVKNIILNLAVGGDFGGDPNGTTVFPQTMLVDYVRVWQRSTGLTGDYNHDGKVDAADYVVWRKTSGQSGIGLAADGSGNGTVGPEDYDVWRQNFGSTALASGAATLALNTPEPTTGVPIAIGILLLFAQRLRPVVRITR